MAHTSDVIVVGAGIIGCAVAHEIARRGARVTLVDRRGPALGATQASAGILAPHIEGHGHGPLLELGRRSLALYDDFVARVREDSPVPFQYERSGTLEVATEEEFAERLRQSAARLAAAGVGGEFLERSAALELEPQLTEEALAAMLIPEHGFVAPGPLTAALDRGAAARGARLIAERRVTRISRRGQSIRVETSQDHLTAGAAVLATGSWASEIDIGGHTPPIRPVRGQLLHLAWSGPPLRRVTWGSHCYLVPWNDGTLLVGATAEEVGFDERTTVAGVRDLLDAAGDLVPSAWKAGFTAARAGLRPATPDDLPAIGASAAVPGLVYALGHYRNGVLLAPITAQLVADLVLEGRTDPALASVSPARFGDC